MIKSVESMLQQDCSDSSVLNKGNNTDEEIVTDTIFHSQNSHEQFTSCHWSSEEGKASSPEEDCVCKELISFDTTLKKFLRKAATFPSSEVESSLLLYTERNRNEESTSTSAPIQNSLGDLFPTYKRSTSLPASSILISAMKGGRAQNTTSLRMDMRVKWAAEVYDPPTTLMSHTVKNNHHQRPKSNKKDNHKNKKHKKGKNCRGNSSGKKVSDWGNVGSSPIPIPAKCSPSQS